MKDGFMQQAVSMGDPNMSHMVMNGFKPKVVVIYNSLLNDFMVFNWCFASVWPPHNRIDCMLILGFPMETPAISQSYWPMDSQRKPYSRIFFIEMSSPNLVCFYNDCVFVASMSFKATLILLSNIVGWNEKEPNKKQYEIRTLSSIKRHIPITIIIYHIRQVNQAS